MERGLNYVNLVEVEEFVSLFGNVVEDTAMVAREMVKLKPFRDAASLLSALDSTINSLTRREKLELLRRIPDLAGRLAQANLLSPESTRKVTLVLLFYNSLKCFQGAKTGRAGAANCGGEEKVEE